MQIRVHQFGERKAVITNSSVVPRIGEKFVAIPHNSSEEELHPFTVDDVIWSLHPRGQDQPELVVDVYLKKGFPHE